jgi:hypothetical protein
MEGQRAEAMVRRLLAQKHSHLWQYAVVPAGEYKFSDLVLNLGIEIKFDRLAAKTGNVAIEIGYKHGPSGLTSTTANFWVFDLDGDIWLTPTQDLRYLCQGRPIIPGGDGLLAELILLPVKELIQYSEYIGQTE